MNLNLTALAFLVMFAFFTIMLFFKGDRNRLYILYICIVFPFISIDFFPSYISPNLFDYITVFFFFLFYRAKKISLYKDQSYMYIFLFLAFIITIGLLSAEGFLKETVTAIIQYFTVFFFAKVLIDEFYSDHTFIYKILQTLQIPLIFSFIFLIAQFYYGADFTFERSQNNNVLGGISVRYPAYFQDPQKYSQYLSVNSLLLLIKGNFQKKISYSNLCLLVLSVIAIFFTGGRAGLAGFIVGIMILVVFGNAQYRMLYISAGIIFVAIFINYAEHFPIFTRLSSLQDDYDFRYAIWTDAFEIFKKNYLFGIGIDNYAYYVSIHNPDQFWKLDNNFSYFNHPESGYLKFLAEFGFAGFIAVMSFFIMPIIKGLKVFITTQNHNILILIAVLLSWMIGFYTLYSLDDNRIRILIVIVICMLITYTQMILVDAKK